MLDDARLKALALVGDAKKAVTEQLVTVTDVSQAQPLEALRDYLEGIESDLDVTELDLHLAELEAYEERLAELDKNLDPKIPDRREITRRVQSAIRAIGAAIEAAEKVAPPI